MSKMRNRVHHLDLLLDRAPAVSELDPTHQPINPLLQGLLEKASVRTSTVLGLGFLRFRAYRTVPPKSGLYHLMRLKGIVVVISRDPPLKN